MKVKYKRFTDTDDTKMKDIQKEFEHDWSRRKETRAKGDTYT